jgi:hypothetical protein
VKKVGNDLKIVNFWILNNSRDICDFGRYLLSSSATSNGRHLATLLEHHSHVIKCEMRWEKKLVCI